MPLGDGGDDGVEEDPGDIARGVVRAASRKRAREDAELFEEVFAEEIEERPVVEPPADYVVGEGGHEARPRTAPKTPSTR